MRPILPCLTLLTVLTLGGTGHAQTTFSLEAADTTVAQTLIESGKQLLDQDEIEQAFAKFSEANRLTQSPAALLGIAECYMRAGKTASAWGALKKAEQRARTLGDASATNEAERKANALEPKLTRLKVILKEGGDAPNVTFDGVRIPDWLGVAVPVDPGKHTLAAVAPGKVTFSTALELSGNGETREVTIPPLSTRPPDPEEPKTKNARRRRHTPNSWALQTAFVLLPTGILVATTGGMIGYYGLLAKDDTVTIVGGSILGAGVVTTVISLLIWPSDDDAKSARGLPWERPWVNVAPFVAKGSSGLILQGTF